MTCWGVLSEDVEKGRQHRSRFAQTLNVPNDVRFEFSLAAALLADFLNILCVVGNPHLHSFPLKYMQVDSPDLTFHVLIIGI
jgi:hypothetical protein